MGNTSIIRPERFDFPTVIVILIKGQERYYKGQLKAVRRTSAVSLEEFLAEQNHRREFWQARAEGSYGSMQSVLYVVGLKQIPQAT